MPFSPTTLPTMQIERFKSEKTGLIFREIICDIHYVF